MTKYSRNMLWAKPYVESAGFLVPLSKLVKVEGYELKPNQKPNQAAIIYKVRGGFKIRIRLTDNFPTDAGHKAAGIFEDVLFALAHELAHMREWEHTAQHLYWTSRILKRFALRAVRERVQDTSRRLLREAA